MTCVVLLLAMAGVGQSPDVSLRTLFDAIRLVETGGESRPEKAIGDGGRSLGPYQISRKYLQDSGVKGTWEKCRDAAFSERVMLAYWKRHCPDALRTRNLEVLARVHNGGPNGFKKSSTAKYWKLVQGHMTSSNTPRKASGRRRKQAA